MAMAVAVADAVVLTRSELEAELPVDVPLPFEPTPSGIARFVRSQPRWIAVKKDFAPLFWIKAQVATAQAVKDGRMDTGGAEEFLAICRAVVIALAKQEADAEDRVEELFSDAHASGPIAQRARRVATGILAAVGAGLFAASTMYTAMLAPEVVNELQAREDVISRINFYTDVPNANLTAMWATREADDPQYYDFEAIAERWPAPPEVLQEGETMVDYYTRTLPDEPEPGSDYAKFLELTESSIETEDRQRAESEAVKLPAFEPAKVGYKQAFIEVGKQLALNLNVAEKRGAREIQRLLVDKSKRGLAIARSGTEAFLARLPYNDLLTITDDYMKQYSGWNTRQWTTSLVLDIALDYQNTREIGLAHLFKSPVKSGADVIGYTFNVAIAELETKHPDLRVPLDNWKHRYQKAQGLPRQDWLKDWIDYWAVSLGAGSAFSSLMLVLYEAGVFTMLGLYGATKRGATKPYTWYRASKRIGQAAGTTLTLPEGADDELVSDNIIEAARHYSSFSSPQELPSIRSPPGSPRLARRRAAQANFEDATIQAALRLHRGDHHAAAAELWRGRTGFS